MHKLLLTVSLVFLSLAAFGIFSFYADQEQVIVQNTESISLGSILMPLAKEETCSDSDDAAESSAVEAILQPGRTPPGGCCKKKSDCALSASGGCGCHRGTDPAKRCCKLGDGQLCYGNDECVSGTCSAGKCKSGKKASGAVCATNEECTSGTCHRPNPTGNWVCS